MLKLEGMQINGFYQQLPERIDLIFEMDILVVKADLNAQVGRDAKADWVGVCGHYRTVEINERILRLLEFVTFNNYPWPHKSLRRWQTYSPGRKHHNQIGNILTRKWLQSRVYRIRKFPGADIESDQDLVAMTFSVHLW